eukprot:CAMPEP_0168344770 /NCGR_PEP_ID=MMETSP0213-20121227/17054_1 /TAXON_ID=151035 /ORGANISM="Euplotes harpa, Strain FSP1.4" /LENGTH=43 /DNA_ID= /DNA_START= /DNA_END= /DNA_ORIENTATION=
MNVSECYDQDLSFFNRKNSDREYFYSTKPVSFKREDICLFDEQ